MRKINIKELLNKNPNIKQDVFCEKYISGMSVKTLSEVYHITTSKTYALLKHWGVAIRNAGGKKKTKEEKYEFIIDKYPIFTKEFVETQYFILNKTLPSLRSEFGIDYKSFLFILEYYGFQKRNLSQGRKLGVEKSKRTCLKKYGVENVSQSSEVKYKKEKTFLKNYGVTNIWKSKDYYKWLDNYMLDNYGQKRICDGEKVSISLKKYWNNLSEKEKQKLCKPLIDGSIKYWENVTDEERLKRSEKISISLKKRWENLSESEKNNIIKILNSGRVSKIEKQFGELLEFLKINYEHSFIFKRKQFDYKISNTNILIEINGDFWHGNPDIYSHTDILNFPNSNGVLAESLWKKDKKKIDIAEKGGFVVLTFWEKWLNETPFNEKCKKIFDEIKKNI